MYKIYHRVLNRRHIVQLKSSIEAMKVEVKWPHFYQPDNCGLGVAKESNGQLVESRSNFIAQSNVAKKLSQ